MRRVPLSIGGILPPQFQLGLVIRIVTGICLLLIIQTATAASPNAASPNIVYIMADDLGIGDVECYGGDRCQIDTPHIDALAADGMMFTDAHAPASVCVPTRVAIMTGRYAWRFQRPSPSGPWAFLNPQIDLERLTLGKMLRASGYDTGYVGKWHLGTLMQTTDGNNQGPTNVDYKKPLQIGPVQYGFDDSFILPGSLDMYPYVFVRNNNFVGEVTEQRGWSAFNRIGPAAKGFEDWKVLNEFSIEAESFIARNAESAKKGRPFFLYVALTSPHTPVSPSPKFEGKSRMGLYGDFVMETDDCVGRVTAALKKHGLSDNTLVVFTSDHGAAPYVGDRREATPGQIRELEKRGHYSSGPYRDYKFSVYEGGLRIPLIVRWPEVTEPGSRCDRLVGLNDVMATFADVTSFELGDSDAVDSVSLRPLLTDPRAESPRGSMILRSVRSFVVRQDNWKLALCPGSGSHILLGNSPTWDEAWTQARKEFGQPARQKDLMFAPFVQLFDLADDPGESHNLAALQPDRVRKMIDFLRKEIDRGRTTPGPDLTNDRKVQHRTIPPEYVYK